MRAIVCIKSVPGTTEVRINPETNTLMRTEVGSIINTFDMYAIEEALRIKEKHGGMVTVMTTGPEGAVEALRSALALGADEAVHLIDPAFTGSDAAATATILAAGIGKLENISLALFGRNAVDTDASSVPGYVAGRLGWPQVLFVRKFVELSEQKAKVERMTEDGFDRCEIPLPGVVSVVKEINEPRLPSLKGKMRAKKAPIKTFSAADLGLDTGKLGPNSPTIIINCLPPLARKKGEILEGEPAEVAAKLFEKLRADQII